MDKTKLNKMEELDAKINKLFENKQDTEVTTNKKVAEEQDKME